MRNKVYLGDAKDILRTFPDESVDCVFTSPPYMGPRDYKLEPIIWDGDPYCEHEWLSQERYNEKLRYRPGHNTTVGKDKNPKIYPNQKQREQFCMKCSAWRGQLGQESDPDDYVRHLLQVLDECMRALKPTGTLWINIDDVHCSKGRQAFDKDKYGGKNAIYSGRARQVNGIRPKSLCGIPARLEIAMIERGWIVRNRNIWRKDNCCPESCYDRFTIDYEDIFMVVKNNKPLFWTNSKTLEVTGKKPKGINGRKGIDWDWMKCYYCNGAGCKRCDYKGKKKRSNWRSHHYYFNMQYEPCKEVSIERFGRDYKSKKNESALYGGLVSENQKAYANKIFAERKFTRQMRSVWSISTKSFHGDHFAVFPETLVELIIDTSVPLAICNECQLPMVPVYGNVRIDTRPGKNVLTGKAGSKDDPNKDFHRSQLAKRRQQIVYKPVGFARCNCNAGFTNGVILDPFCGSGTVGAVAKSMGRDYVLIDASPKYVDMTQERIESVEEEYQLALF